MFAFGEGVQVSVHKYRQNKKAQTIKRLSVLFGTVIHNTRNSPTVHICKFRTIAFPHKERKVFMNTNSNISYSKNGDYMIPNLTLSPEEANIGLGKWGMMHKDYLLKNKKVLFTTLLTQGKLYQHCAEVEKQARNMFDTLVEQMKKSEGVTEQLKEENQMEWVYCVQNIEARVREIVNYELIF